LQEAIEMYAVRLSLVALVCVLASFTGFPATPLRADSPDLTNFAGEWDGHGFELNVGPDGQAVASWRVYQWCRNPTVTAACDSIINNVLIDGGLAMLRITSVSGGTADALVISSTQSNTLTAGEHLEMTLLPGGITSSGVWRIRVLLWS
jgi:hypothetical protein